MKTAPLISRTGPEKEQHILTRERRFNRSSNMVELLELIASERMSGRLNVFFSGGNIDSIRVEEKRNLLHTGYQGVGDSFTQDEF